MTPISHTISRLRRFYQRSRMGRFAVFLRPVNRNEREEHVNAR